MSILDSLIAKIAPHDCLACGAEGHLLCAACAGQLTAVPERCYRCWQLTPGALTCPDCRRDSQLWRVQVSTIYEGNAKNLIWKLKLAGAQVAARTMARRMSLLISHDTAKAVIVPVPTATGRVRQRGYDQAKLLARELSRQARLPYRDCLTRGGQTHQHGLSRRQRLAQLASAFRVSKPGAVRQAHLILVDDVTTTGATLEAAAAVLLAAGAARVDALVFAQPKPPAAKSRGLQ